MQDRLKHMKETLMCAVEMQLCELGEVDTKELGEAIDMIKDLEEAIYYCTVTEAMTNPQKIEKRDHHQEYDEGRMYYSPSNSSGGNMNSSNSNGGNTNSSSGRNYMERDRGYRMETDEPRWRDEREGRSYNNRRMYMEAKDMNKDKASQMRELEKYMQELGQDITEMISDASADEKAYLEKKISALAAKIGQMK